MYKKWIIIFIFGYFFVVIFFIIKEFSHQKMDREFSYIGSWSRVEAIKLNNHISIKQEFIGVEDNMYRLGIQVVNTFPQNDGVFSASLFENDNLIAQRRISISMLSSVRFFQVYFDHQIGSKDKKYDIILETDVPEEFPLTLFIRQRTKSESFLFSGKEEVRDREILFFSSYTNPHSVYIQWKDAPRILERIMIFKPNFIKNFYISIIALYGISIGIFFYYFGKKLL